MGIVAQKCWGQLKVQSQISPLFAEKKNEAHNFAANACGLFVVAHKRSPSLSVLKPSTHVVVKGEDGIFTESTVRFKEGEGGRKRSYV